MDNDLMARRLRPPSEPPRPSNGHSPANTQLPSSDEPAPWAHDEASWATEENRWATEELENPQGMAPPSTNQPPWAQDVDVRAGIPWDRPEPEAWPPATDEPESTTAPAAQAVVERSWPPVVEPSAAPQGGSVEAGTTSPLRAVNRPSTWDDLPSPWDMPVVHTQAAPVPQATAAPWDTPSATEPEADEQGPLEAAVPGQASWDRPAPTGWDDFVVDDRPAEMLSAYDEEPEAQAAADPEPSQEPAPSLADPYDADAPVLSDVTPPAAPTWADWAPTFDPAPEPVEMLQAHEPEPAEPVATPPMQEDRALSPTPPADLFRDNSAERGQPFGDAQHQSSAQSVWPEPAAAVVPEPAAAVVPSTTEPVVFRIELEIVGDSMRVRPIEAVHRPSPPPVTPPVTPAVTPAVATAADAAPAAREDESVTPRHPEFEPRSQLAAEPEPASPSAAVPWDDWALPPLEQSAEQPRSPWSDPDPVAAWQLEATPSTDPLAALPAASFMTAAPAPALAAPLPASPAAAAQVARPVSEQPDLWFLAAEPQALQNDDAAEAHKAEEPSSMLTIGLTVLMGIVVVGLIIAFLWLMTSLPILR